MQYNVTTIEDYINEIPTDRKDGIINLYQAIKTNLPLGFEENISYGHIAFVVPFSIYPKGYHCDNSQPLPFISIASQKNHIALYHMAMYMNPTLNEWFVNEFPKYSSKKLDSGKSCIRFKKVQDIPFELIGLLAQKISVEDYVNLYESLLNSKK